MRVLKTVLLEAGLVSGLLFGKMSLSEPSIPHDVQEGLMILQIEQRVSYILYIIPCCCHSFHLTDQFFNEYHQNVLVVMLQVVFVFVDLYQFVNEFSEKVRPAENRQQTLLGSAAKKLFDQSHISIRVLSVVSS